MKVPFVDLNAQYELIRDEMIKTTIEVLDSKNFIEGPYVENFSKSFVAVHGGEYAWGCSNGTSAISVALNVLKIGPGDEVITVANTFFATVEAIAEVGAKIVLVDCDPATYSIDIKKVREKINKNTKAIIPVHLYGNPVNMTELCLLAEEFNLLIIEDCAQAHMAKHKNQAMGSFGSFGTFSFYPGKNLGACGDAGLILAKNAELLKQVKMFVNHGRLGKYEHEILAGNHRMDGIQAAILSVKLKYLSEWTKKRQAIAKRYDESLKKAGFKVIEVDEQNECSYHLYVVEVSNREEVSEHFRKNDIGFGVHYPIPMHKQPALSHLNFREGDFPVSEKAAKRILSLPMYAELTEEQQRYVIQNFFEVAKV